MIPKIKYIKCIQTHNWDTKTIKKGDAGKIISLDKGYAIIEVNDSFTYKINTNNYQWISNLEAFFIHELKMDYKYVNKYKGIYYSRKHLDFYMLCAKLLRANVEYAIILNNIKSKIDSILMDQALN